jgi:hypothetical protein
MANKLTPQQLDMFLKSMQKQKNIDNTSGISSKSAVEKNKKQIVASLPTASNFMQSSNTKDNTSKKMLEREQMYGTEEYNDMIQRQKDKEEIELENFIKEKAKKKTYLNDAGPEPVYKNIGEKVRADLERESRQRDLEASIPNKKLNAWAENVAMPVADAAMIAQGLYSAPALLRALGSNLTKSELLSAGEGIAKESENASNAGRFNLERTTEKSKKDILKQYAEEGNFKVSTRGSSSGKIFNVGVESPTGKVSASLNPDGTYGLAFEDENAFNAGKSMLKLKDKLAGKTIYETKSFSPDSYTNILKLKSKLPYEEAGYIPLNSQNKNVNFLNDLILENKGGEYNPSAIFKSEKDAIEGAKRMDEYMAKLGEKSKSKVVNNNGRFEVHVPNYKIKVPERVNENTIKVLKSKK